MDQPTWIGRTLSGRYKIESLLGQGGMSAVYKASDPNLKRVVAIKLIHLHLSTDPMFVMRFESEAAAVASLRHQNIVQVYDFNNDNGIYYMVLEFIPGETLQDRMKRLVEDKRKLSLEDSLKYILNISDAVGYSHQRGMVHRDIKPANIMLDVQGQAILMDFGIVKILGGESHTSTGAVVGTARYMPPEIIRGEVADNRSDIYSLGVTLYEMLSGRPPFLADSAMTLMMMHLNDPVPDVRGFRSDIRPEVVAILQKCLAKARNDRYQSAAELSADLKRALASIGGQPTSIRIRESAPKLEGSTSTSDHSPVVHSQNESVSAIQSQPHSQPVPPPYKPPPPSRTKSSARPIFWIAGAGILFICCVVLIFFLRPNLGSSVVATATQSLASIDAGLTGATEQVIPSDTPAPSETPTDTPAPTATYPPLYARINSITVNVSGQYVVDYETFGFTEALPGMHVHFFFNTVPQEEAGSPGKGPWKLYGGPRPFRGYRESDRPSNATQMCALVANNNHSVIAESGNCVNLP